MTAETIETALLPPPKARPIRREHRGAVASLTLQRPERLNALDCATIDTLLACLDAIEADPGDGMGGMDF